MTPESEIFADKELRNHTGFSGTSGTVLPARVVIEPVSPLEAKVSEFQDFLNVTQTGEIDGNLEKVLTMAKEIEELSKKEEAQRLFERFVTLIGDAKEAGYLKQDVDLVSVYAGFVGLIEVPDPEALFTRILEGLENEETNKGFTYEGSGDE